MAQGGAAGAYPGTAGVAVPPPPAPAPVPTFAPTPAVTPTPAGPPRDGFGNPLATQTPIAGPINGIPTTNNAAAAANPYGNYPRPYGYSAGYGGYYDYGPRLYNYSPGYYNPGYYNYSPIYRGGYYGAGGYYGRPGISVNVGRGVGVRIGF